MIHSYETILIGLVILHFTALYIATLIALTKLRLLPRIVCPSQMSILQSLQGLVSPTIQYFPNPYKYDGITRLIAFATSQHTLGVRYDSPILWIIIPIGAYVTTACAALGLAVIIPIGASVAAACTTTGLAGIYMLIHRIYPKTETCQTHTE